MSNRTIDQACEVEEMLRANALAKFQAAQRSRVAVSAFECEDCGEPIPEARRVAILGCATCVDCQTDRERYAKT